MGNISWSSQGDYGVFYTSWDMAVVKAAFVQCPNKNKTKQIWLFKVWNGEESVWCVCVELTALTCKLFHELIKLSASPGSCCGHCPHNSQPTTRGNNSTSTKQRLWIRIINGNHLLRLIKISILSLLLWVIEVSNKKEAEPSDKVCVLGWGLKGWEKELDPRVNI